MDDANITTQGMIADLEEAHKKLATRDKMWDQIEAKLSHHVMTLGKECTNLEETVSSSKPTNLGPELQRYLAGNTQRIAKLVCTKADFEVIRKIVVSNDPATIDWDEEVGKLRTRYKNEFIKQVTEEAKKKHPMTDLLIDEARQKFMMKLDLCVKVAMSKFARVQIGATILGRRQLVPTCMACDRPFNKDGGTSKGEGDMRGVSRDALPARNDDDDGSLGSMSMSMGSPSRGEHNVVPFGVDQRKLDKYVFRAGFKIPKQVTSPLEIGGSNMFSDDESSMGSVSTARPHTTVGAGGGSRRGGRKMGGGKGSRPLEELAHTHAASGDLPPVRQGTSPSKYR